MNINKIGFNPISAYNLSVQKNFDDKPRVQHKQINSLSNIAYKPLSFGRTWAEHKSWGATINPKTKEASFKILTFPDAKGVSVTVQKNGDEENTKTYELENKGSGIFETPQPISADEVKHGDKYFYTITKQNGEVENVKDPYSFKQESLLGSSTIYDHSLYEWHDDDWFNNNPHRISRLANGKNKLTSVNQAKIFEVNTATVTKDGTFEGLKDVVDRIKPLGFNAIEIMPVENTYSFNWGYDGVDKMAPAEHLGGPDELKDLIDYAHEKGVNVIMDMVPNHLGPDGAALGRTGPYLKGPNAFGDAFNFEGYNSKYVRDYIVNAAINWLDNYHCDGLRLDMTKFMESDATMKQIAAEVNYHKPDAFLIAEDGRSDNRVTAPLNDLEKGVDEQSHVNSVDNITVNNTSFDNLGFDSEWAFEYYHALKDAVYGSSDMERLNQACNNSQRNVKYTMSHDEIGNFEGTRLAEKLMVPMLNLNYNLELNDEDYSRASKLAQMKGMDFEAAKQTVIFQKAQLSSEKLAKLLQTGELDRFDTTGMSEEDEEAVNQQFEDFITENAGIKRDSGITYGMVKTIYNECLAKGRMALARTYSIPGPKMVFQGDENADLTPFRFFRQFDSIKNEDYLYTEKGYKEGVSALNESTIGNIDYSDSAKESMKKYEKLTADLNKLSAENPALTEGRLVPENAVIHPISQVIGTHSVADKNEVFSITNFQNSNYPRNDATYYYIKLPQGKWVQLLSTDDKKYGGTGKFNNKNIIESDGYNNSPIKLAAHSTVIFRRIDT